MALKRNGPDSNGAGAPGRGPAEARQRPGSTPDSDVVGGSTAFDADIWTPSSVTYESEEETAAPAAAKKGTKPGKTILKSVHDRFPGVFQPPNDAVAPMAPASSFDAPTDDNALPSIRSTGSSGKRSASVTNWSIHTVAELIQFRDEINAHLPPTELSELNLEQEVLLQFHVMRELQSDVLAEKDLPANQRAAVANSVASILRTLADRQSELYTSERFKDIENLLIRTLTLFPEDVASKFLTEYERIIRN